MADLIIQWSQQNQLSVKEDILLVDYFKQQSPIQAFENIDPVAYQ